LAFGDLVQDHRTPDETLHLLSVPGMRESIHAGMAEPLADSAKAHQYSTLIGLPSLPR